MRLCAELQALGAAVELTPATAADDDDARFAPPPTAAAPLELELDRPPPLPPAPRPPPPPRPAGVDERPPAASPSSSPIAGRLLGGALRRQPAQRVAIGVVLGLGLGWLFSQPYAGRAERRVAELRAEADRERYRPVDEARARVAAFDDEADRAATRGALGAATIWLLVGAGAFAAWWRIT